LETDGRLDHLDLVSGGRSPRPQGTLRKPPLRGRDRAQFAREALESIRGIVDAHRRSGEEFPGYDLDLLFRIRVSKYRGREVTRSLRRADCEPVVTRLEEDDDWVVRAGDRGMKSLKGDIESHSGRKAASYIDAIQAISGICPAAKHGPLLRESPLGDTEQSCLIVSFWRGPGEDGEARRAMALRLLRAVVREAGFGEIEAFATKNMCQAIVTSNAALLARIAQIDYVSRVDRPPEFQLTQTVRRYGHGDTPVSSPPDPGASGIAVIDTGVINHPLLEDAMGEGIPMTPVRDSSMWHGTQVAGMAAHGHIEDCIASSKFKPGAWIYSVQVMQEISPGKPKFQLSPMHIGKSIDLLKKKHPACRVANMSVVAKNSEITEGTQADLSIVIDEASSRHKDMIFVAAAGNADEAAAPDPHYPHCLFAASPARGILAPGTSSHAITVGSIRKPSGPREYMPSSTTRVGPGIDGAIKPELVHVGGDLHDQVIALNSLYRENPFLLSMGTSLSAPIVSNYVARLLEIFPEASRNLITALLLSSAELPPTSALPGGILGTTGKKERERILRVYGYGMPSLDRASHSERHRVVLKHEGAMPVDSVEYFAIGVPQDFARTRGRRAISVTLAFDPPCDPHQPSYTGTRMEFRMHANLALEDVKRRRTSNSAAGANGANPGRGKGGSAAKRRLPELDMFPGTTLRRKSNHQKGIYERIARTCIDPKFPLVLAVECEAMWDAPGTTEQPFSVAVSMSHEAMPDLYEKVRALNPGRARAR